MQEFNQHLLQKGYSTSTVKRYQKDVELFIKWAEKENIPISQVNNTDILYYIQSKRNQVKQKTISIHINSLKHYFDYLSITEQITENPTREIQIKGIKRKTLYHILSKQELESLYNNFEILNEETSKYKNQNWFKTSLLASKRNKVITVIRVKVFKIGIIFFVSK